MTRSQLQVIDPERRAGAPYAKQILERFRDRKDSRYLYSAPWNLRCTQPNTLLISRHQPSTILSSSHFCHQPYALYRRSLGLDELIRLFWFLSSDERKNKRNQTSQPDQIDQTDLFRPSCSSRSLARHAFPAPMHQINQTNQIDQTDETDLFRPSCSLCYSPSAISS